MMSVKITLYASFVFNYKLKSKLNKLKLIHFDFQLFIFINLAVFNILFF